MAFLINRHLKIVNSLVVFFLLLPSLSLAGQHPVIRIIDGDTIIVNYQGNPEKVRLLCVNTPESVHPDKKQNIPLGKVASDYTKKRLKGEYVDLEFEGRLRGNYGRLLAYVIVDGQNFNLELVKQGLSPYYTKYGLSKKYDKEFRAAERLARKAKLGIWGDPELARKYLRLKSKWGQSKSLAGDVAAHKDTQVDTGTYIGNARSHKFHRSNCRWAKKIGSGNRVFFKSRLDAVNQGYSPCKVCKP